MLRYSMLPACVSHSHSGDDNDPSKSQAAFRRASISTVFRNTCNVMDTDEQSQCTASAQDIAKARPRTPLELQPQPSQDLLQSQFSQELFCTPVEQIDNDMSGNNSGSMLNVSPRRLVKRPRPVGFTHVLPPKPRQGRPRSPMYRNPFLSEDDEKTESRPTSRQPRFPQTKSRFSTEFRSSGEAGSGNFSRVFKARHRMDGCLYAIKRSKVPVIAEADKAKWLQEVQVMATIGTHVNIVRYYSAWAEADHVDGAEHLYIQMELCESNLSSRIGTVFLESELVEIARQMAAALHHLHARGIVHLDVKPDNIYKSADGTYKLGDFGMATGIKGPATDEGDSRYLSLELLNNDHSNLDKADMFALGATLYELASRSRLPTGGQRFEVLRKKPILLLTCSTHLVNLISSLMREDPLKRPSAEAVMKSAVLTKRPLAFASASGPAAKVACTSTVAKLSKHAAAFPPSKLSNASGPAKH